MIIVQGSNLSDRTLVNFLRDGKDMPVCREFAERAGYSGKGTYRATLRPFEAGALKKGRSEQVEITECPSHLEREDAYVDMRPIMPAKDDPSYRPWGFIWLPWAQAAGYTGPGIYFIALRKVKARVRKVRG